MLPEFVDELRMYLDRNLDETELVPFASGLAAVYSARCPGKETPNEDAAALITCGPGRGVLAIADGFGGQAAGEQAARLALESVAQAISATVQANGSLRGGILDGFEKANEAVSALGVGAATTLAVLEIDQRRIRSYHVGDSVILVVGQRGKLKLQTLSHSPVGYAVEAGYLEEVEALHHEDLHIVSNMIGSPDMRIEIGSGRTLRARDTVLLGTDGLFDNLHTEEVLEIIRKGSLTEAAGLLAAESDRRMRTPDAGQPHKPDDLTFIMYRLQA